jgi:hypothetical protein
MEYGTANTNVPSVWRTNRTQASERVSALASGGMDDVEIPAFLRKQAEPLSGFAASSLASPEGDDAIAAGRPLLGISELVLASI